MFGVRDFFYETMIAKENEGREHNDIMKILVNNFRLSNLTEISMIVKLNNISSVETCN